MSCLLRLLLVLLQVILQTIESAGFNITLHPHCQESCGGVSIPYPFGIGKGCYKEEFFEIQCKSVKSIMESSVVETMPYSYDLPVTDFSVQQGRATMLAVPTFDCYNKSGLAYTYSDELQAVGGVFFVSSTRNKFTAIGCNTVAYITGNKTDRQYQSGCMTFCERDNQDSGCMGTGCCQSSLPDLALFSIVFDKREANDTTWGYNPCSYAFIADESFSFNVSYLRGENFWHKFPYGAPMAIDWVFAPQTCQEAKKNISSYGCLSINSECTTHNGTNEIEGYTCSCSEGHEGNPYLKDGCQDIDECNLKDQHPCPPGSICTNTKGNYTCSCPRGYYSESPMTSKCYKKDNFVLGSKLTVGISIAVISLLVLGLLAYRTRKKRSLAREKERFFQQNGGWLLYQELECKGGRVSFKIYTRDDLEKATNNFDNGLVLGRGGQGMVYQGTLEDGRVVAIKKSRTLNITQKEDFVKEILVLSQVNHNNIVKLLGCCLEVDVPMLVYEYVSNGTLHNYIHGNAGKHGISLSTRLRIASESANALTYLHFAASPPILHRDVKSSNILLDENYVAKVSDFGASILSAVDETQLMTVVQGTFGYLDPEYMLTFKFSEKSDVYSFGVVLLELLTRKKAIHYESSEEVNLASSFVSMMQEGRVIELLDDQLKSIVLDNEQREVILGVVELAKECVRINGHERPTMREVAEELQRLRKSRVQEQHESEDLKVFKPVTSEPLPSSYSAENTIATFSLDNIETGR